MYYIHLEDVCVCVFLLIYNDNIQFRRDVPMDKVQHKAPSKKHLISFRYI